MDHSNIRGVVTAFHFSVAGLPLSESGDHRIDAHSKRRHPRVRASTPSVAGSPTFRRTRYNAGKHDKIPLRGQHGGSLKLSRAQVRERLVCLNQRIPRRLDLDADLRSQAQEIESILTRQIRD
jgi:hypothetical protein